MRLLLNPKFVQKRFYTQPRIASASGLRIVIHMLVFRLLHAEGAFLILVQEAVSFVGLKL